MPLVASGHREKISRKATTLGLGVVKYQHARLKTNINMQNKFRFHWHKTMLQEAKAQQSYVSMNSDIYFEIIILNVVIMF